MRAPPRVAIAGGARTRATKTGREMSLVVTTTAARKRGDATDS
jgi:hypothetical protein